MRNLGEGDAGSGLLGEGWEDGDEGDEGDEGDDEADEDGDKGRVADFLGGCGCG
jgi:hypothetical protein